MEGAALGWFQWMEMHEPVMTWDEFKEAILDKFGSTQDGDLQEQLMALRQTGTMWEYRGRFEIMMSLLKDVPTSTLKSVFINGLAQEIKIEVPYLGPETLK